MGQKTFLIVLVAALLIKSSLFMFTVNHAPEGKFNNDSWGYIDLANSLMTGGIFTRHITEENPWPETFRTPGYPLFLGILHNGLHISYNGIIAIQILMTLLTAWVTYKTAVLIDRRLGFLSAAIILLDFQILISSLLLMTETLFMLVLSLFMYCFIKYLKTRTWKTLVLAALFLAAAVYIRPIAYYLGLFLAVFIVFCPSENKQWSIPGKRQAAFRALIFLMIVFGCLGIWQWRNYVKIKNPRFSSINMATTETFGLVHSYSHYQDFRTKGLSPVPYYINVTIRSFFSLMATPGTLKYFKNDTLKKAGAIFAYPWIIFLLMGLLIGSIRIPPNMYFYFLLLTAGYFICTSFMGIGMWVEPRFRVPFMPFVAILSAYGWQQILRFRQEKRIKQPG